MEILEERALSSPYTPRFHSQTPVARCSSSPGPLCCGNYCSSLGKWDLHLRCNYSRTSTAKGSKGAGEAAMGSLPSQQQAHSEDHASWKQPAQPQPCSHTLTHPQTLAFLSVRGAPGHSRSHRWPPGTARRKPPIPFPKSFAFSHPRLQDQLQVCSALSPESSPAGGSSAAVWWLPDTRVPDTEIEQSPLRSHVGHQEKPWASDFALPAQPGQPPPHFHRHKIHQKRSV